jgi:glutamate--cysteine ligase
MKHNFIDLKEKIIRQYPTLVEQLFSKDCRKKLPLYTSVDIRESHYKTAVIDANLFPAGFNNLCRYSTNRISDIFNDIILERNPACKRVLIIAEEHTRNKFYLENVYTLSQFLKEAGFEIEISSFFNDNPIVCQERGQLDFETASGKLLSIFCVEWLKRKIHNKEKQYDLVILNNDLTRGVPQEMLELGIPIYPSYKAGWHSRVKSLHFEKVQYLMRDLLDGTGIDPYFFTTEFDVVNNVDIHSESDRQLLYEKAVKLFESMSANYKKYKIDQKPLLFLKANQGTYGMGVTAIESAQDILNFNRKIKNNLAKGKESKVIESFLLQEGIPSVLTVNNNPAELCLYYAGAHYLGGFYRVNSVKSDRQNLNSTGMHFKKMCIKNNGNCPYSDSSNEIDDCGEAIINSLPVYQLLALVSVHASQKEIQDLEAV